MKTCSAIAPEFYGNPKVHKADIPLRPIISSVNVPTNSIAKYLAEILSVAYNKDNDYYVRHSFHFAGQINGFNLPRNHVLVSFDVVNLYGNIPTNLITIVIQEKW